MLTPSVLKFVTDQHLDCHSETCAHLQFNVSRGCFQHRLPAADTSVGEDDRGLTNLLGDLLGYLPQSLIVGEVDAIVVNAGCY